ncbi:MAG: SUMF1/EgtB/PvdO family nonheme iron enzyme [Verrucomicrobia bacterium]|nr:SUMF1/EgtB/PvdO family nonheme iron enzyme [Verrucomicrobiota bacterium]
MKTQRILSHVCGWAAFLLMLQTPTLRAQEMRYYRVLGPVATTLSYTEDGWLTFTNIPTNALFTVQVTARFDTNVWLDYVQVPVTGATTIVRVHDPSPPAGMALIPGGPYTRGDFFGDHASGASLPLNSVRISPFYMDKHEVTKALWDEVYQWATNNGYLFYAGSGQGKATNHPVQFVSWLDAAVWCNARSEMEGLTRCYYTNTTAYKSIPYHPTDVNWDANGYRLPTEAEWEKAARGGLSGKRFPWGDTITHSNANYFSVMNVPYDANPLVGPHPAFEDGALLPYTSPVGHFAPNGYGLYDMAGNVQELCWDYYSGSYYSSTPLVDPRGPNFNFPSVTGKVARGGYWNSDARFCTVSLRGGTSEATRNNILGFRCVRTAGP